LGATGTVGQRFITLLSAHPFLTIHALGASSRSAGKPYTTATKWKQSSQVPPAVASMIVKPCETSEFADCDVVFSGLDADVAGDIEAAFRSADLAIFSNAKNYRRDPVVPLLVPLANPEHLSVIPHQQAVSKSKKGFIVTNSNCSTAGLVVPLQALQHTFGPLKSVNVVTMQAISGGGYPGVPSLDILDNVVPYISGEEEKMEWETLKIIGDTSPENTGFELRQGLDVSAQCNRVAVLDGHTLCVSVTFQNASPSVEEVKECMRMWSPLQKSEALPSAPHHAIHVFEEADRPQPRLDREVEGGYAVSVGRVRECRVGQVKFVALVHNTVLGAAGMGILNAELAIQKGYI